MGFEFAVLLQHFITSSSLVSLWRAEASHGINDAHAVDAHETRLQKLLDARRGVIEPARSHGVNYTILRPQLDSFVVPASRSFSANGRSGLTLFLFAF